MELDEIKKMVEDFNRDHEVGTEVIVKFGEGDLVKTKTRSGAMYLYEDPVVWVDGFVASVDLRDVEVSTGTRSDSQAG